ncbi:DUF1353 domain-containing protein [Fulvimarina endophytica]|uniref:DUF1353 domain-containing protein n=1 Tax=Fulvimarina endophytica TaxID=2293836 RepID=A0A371X2Y1_9HYPH|nr:DUF1353 domain-containing protein [Fulvimarina endophytica]RFC63591.1 DUF1353 domain-containing protein [Fulvimarina endophytica]
MSRFTGPLAVTFLSAKTGLASLDQPLIWEVGEEGSGKEVVIPRGVVSDGVTSPRIIWWLVPPWGSKATRPAMLHDFGICLIKMGEPHTHMPTRKAVDHEFWLALQACGIGPIAAAIMWMGVRSWSLLRSIFDRMRRDE